MKQEKTIWKKNYKDDSTYWKVVNDSKDFIEARYILKKEFNYVDRYIFEFEIMEDKK